MSSINSLVNQKRNKNLIRRTMLAAIAGCLMSVCIAFAGTVDIATNFFGLVVTVIAKGLLNAADIVLEPLLEITTMSTADVSRFVPGFDSGNNIGNFFIQAINIIAYMIAGVLICCHIISYLINIAHGEKVESIPKLIWNAVFGIVMVICGKTFLTMIFNEIVAPLSSALTEGVSDAGGTFSFSGVGSDMTGLGEITSAFDLNSLATLIVVLALMLIIWWNLIKLVLECAERYIICIFTINLSPLAFATMASENTKDTARSWLQMFWSQCVLLILNIWVVGIARTALNNGLFGASNTEMVKWGLITYAFLKIAQRLDDMMQTAGLKITRTTGLDPISEASGVLRSIGNVFGGVASVAGHVAGVGKNMWDAGKNIGKANGVEPIKSFADFMNGGETSAQDGGYVNNASMADKMKADAVLGKETMYDRADKMASGALNADSYNTDAYKQVLEDKLRSAGHLDDDAHVESVKIGEDGKLLASAVKRDEKNRVSEKSEFEIGDTQEGLLDVNGAKKYDSMQVAPNGKSVMEEDSAMGKFGLRKVGEDAAGNQIWEAEQSVNMFGDKVKDVTPDANNKVQFTIPASEIAKGRKAGDSDAMTAYKHFNANDDNDAFKNSIRDALSAETGSAALNKARENEEEQAAMATRIGMTDKERLADMMNPDSNADYNSPNAFKAMEDHIKENAQYYPAQAAMLADGGHVTGMHVSDGTDGNPAGSLIVAIGNDQDGKNSQATCTFTRDEEPVPETAETPAAQTNEQPVKDADAAPAPVNEDAPAPVGEEASAPAPQSADETTAAPATETAQAPVPQDMDSKVDAPAPVSEEASAPAPQSADEAPTAPATETAQAPVPQDVDSKVDAPAPVGEEASAPAPQSVDETATTPVAETAQTPVPQDIDSEVDAPAPVGEEAATPAPQDVGGKADAPVPASENASAPATQSADGKVAEPTSADGATPASGVTAPAPVPAQNPTTNTVNAPVQGAAPVSGGTVPGAANAPKTANVPGMAANNMPASTAPETAATPAVNAPAPASTTGTNAPTSVPGTTPAPSTASGQSSTAPGSGTAPTTVRPATGAGSVSAPAPSASIPTAPVSGGSAGVAVAAGVAAGAVAGTAAGQAQPVSAPASTTVSAPGSAPTIPTESSAASAPTSTTPATTTPASAPESGSGTTNDGATAPVVNHEASAPTAPIPATAPASTQESGETASAPSTATTPATQITPETASAPSESDSSSAGGHATTPNEGTTHSESSGTGSVSDVPGAGGTDTLGRSDSAPTSTNGQESGSAPAQGSGGTMSPATADTASAVPESAPAESATTTNVATPAPVSDTGSSEPSGDSGSSFGNDAGSSSGSAPASGESAHAPSGSGSSGSGTSVSAPASSGNTGSSSESASSGSANDSTDTPTSETGGTSSETVEAPAADGLPYAVGETGGSGYSEGDMPPEPETTVETETAATEVVQVEQAAEQQSSGSAVTETVDEAGSESNTQNSHDDSENYSGGQNTDAEDVSEPDSADEPDTQDETEDTEFDATDDAAFDVPIADGSEYYEDKAQTNSFTAPEQEMAEPEPVAEHEHESEPEQLAEQKRPPIPEAYMTSQSSVTRLSSTNGTVESDSLGMFQMTREEVADNGWTTWRILQKVDSDGSVPEYAPFVVHIKPVWDPATRTSRPATFDEVANKARSIEGFENVGPDLDADYRRSQARQESRKNSEPRPYNGHSNGQPHFQRYDDQKRDSHGHGKQDKKHNPFSGMGDYKRKR